MIANTLSKTSFRATLTIKKKAEESLKKDFAEFNSYRCSKMKEMFGEDPFNYDDEIKLLKKQFEKMTSDIAGSVELKVGKNYRPSDTVYSEYTVSYKPEKSKAIQSQFNIEFLSLLRNKSLDKGNHFQNAIKIIVGDLFSTLGSQDNIFKQIYDKLSA